MVQENVCFQFTDAWFSLSFSSSSGHRSPGPLLRLIRYVAPCMGSLIWSPGHGISYADDLLKLVCGYNNPPIIWVPIVLCITPLLKGSNPITYLATVLTSSLKINCKQLSIIMVLMYTELYFVSEPIHWTGRSSHFMIHIWELSLWLQSANVAPSGPSLPISRQSSTSKVNVSKTKTSRVCKHNDSRCCSSLMNEKIWPPNMSPGTHNWLGLKLPGWKSLLQSWAVTTVPAVGSETKHVSAQPTLRPWPRITCPSVQTFSNFAARLRNVDSVEAGECKSPSGSSVTGVVSTCAPEILGKWG